MLFIFSDLREYVFQSIRNISFCCLLPPFYSLPTEINWKIGTMIWTSMSYCIIDNIKYLWVLYNIYKHEHSISNDILHLKKNNNAWLRIILLIFESLGTTADNWNEFSWSTARSDQICLTILLSNLIAVVSILNIFN